VLPLEWIIIDIELKLHLDLLCSKNGSMEFNVGAGISEAWVFLQVAQV
jgi:hypothetical protein